MADSSSSRAGFHESFENIATRVDSTHGPDNQSEAKQKTIANELSRVNERPRDVSKAPAEKTPQMIMVEVANYLQSLGTTIDSTKLNQFAATAGAMRLEETADVKQRVLIVLGQNLGGLSRPETELLQSKIGKPEIVQEKKTTAEKTPQMIMVEVMDYLQGLETNVPEDSLRKFTVYAASQSLEKTVDTLTRVKNALGSNGGGLSAAETRMLLDKINSV